MTYQIYRGPFALCAWFALAGAACAQTVVLSAGANSSLTAITITGKALQPVSGPPLVSLAGQKLTVMSFNNTQISAALPAGIAPGSYNLAVTAKGAANFDVAIGGSGSTGPAGPAGPAGPQGAPGPALSLPFSGSVASPNTAFSIVNTAGAGIVVQGTAGIAATILGGIEGGNGDPAIAALGGGGSGVTSGGAAFSGTGGLGSALGGDGIDATGGAATGSGNNQAGGNGVFAVGGAAGISASGGPGVVAYGGAGDDNTYAAGIYALGGNAVGGCIYCAAGAGGRFVGGLIPANIGEGGDGVDAFAGSGVGIYVTGGNFQAGIFNGDVNVIGNLAKSGGSFQIDHPLDPANKYLYHSFVESPDMKNVYDGTVVTDGGGRATVALPDWFETLNSDFRYQLTAIGQFSQAIVASKINHNAFAIRTDKPNVEVSWQVTGIRQDAWANAHRIPVEAEKDKADQGHYLHPELFDHAGEPSIAEMHHPRPKQRQQQ
ncbi:MAG: hypothetical protein ABSC93_29580 [Bryobacteraceae bacterium]